MVSITHNYLGNPSLFLPDFLYDFRWLSDLAATEINFYNIDWITGIYGANQANFDRKT